MPRSLLSVPAPLARFLRPSTAGDRLADFVHSDPPSRKLGSGGGTASLLHAAWQRLRTRSHLDLWDWVNSEQNLILHAGGESRRLPAYAALGKSLLPVPPLGAASPRRFDQTLIDFQRPAYAEVLREAGHQAAALVASGDVWLDLNALQIPRVTADICGIGMRVAPEVARHFGVFFVAKFSAREAAREQPIAFFLQKPTPAEIYRHLSHYDFYVDTGLWLLSRPALQLLFRRCGWSDRTGTFTTGDRHPRFLDLYTEFGLALGTRAKVPSALRRLGWSRLKTSIVPLEEARFFHLGSSRQLLDSFDQLLSSGVRDGKIMGSAATRKQVETKSTLPAWLDRVSPQNPVQLGGLNLLTGLPADAGPITLHQEQCLDVTPAIGRDFIFRPYLLDDRLRGRVELDGTICGQPAKVWLERRRLACEPRSDVFDAAIYPIIPAHEIGQPLLDWFFLPEPDAALTARLARYRRISAAQIPEAVDFRRAFAQRATNQALALQEEFEACLEHGDTRVFAQDFAAIASAAQREFPELRRWLLKHSAGLLARLSRPEHQSRLLALLAQLRSARDRAPFARQAYERLQSTIVAAAKLAPARPRLALKEDQIVWGRSPVRLDLAGGWTDTPPYCFENGGAVLNAAVLLNGQPPIQVFVRPLSEPVISLRSIDLGTHEVISSDRTLGNFRDPRSSFSLPKAALSLAGFHPDFAPKSHATLRQRLSAFGGGLEISLLSAVPKGSGLGTSSILGATLLGALNRACRLGWDEVSLYNRVLAIEQLLTTGGGWQDQAGALFRGVKLVQTSPGVAQTPTVRFLPDHLLGPTYANQSLLLYYTGITRLAKGILAEIVGDMFLGRFETLQTLSLIRANAFELFSAFQQADAGALHRCIGRSWELNKRLDPGTSTPAIEKLLRQCGSDLAAAKLLGAGGGGYMLLCAKSVEGGRRIREKLEIAPPNPRARFIDFKLAEKGLEVTVS